MLNNVQLIGNLVKDPEFVLVNTDRPFCKLRLAVDGRRKDDPTSFFNIITWSQNAIFARDYLSKGRRILVEGRLQQRSWTAQDGTNRSEVEVVAERISPLDRPKVEEPPIPEPPDA